MLTIAVLGGAIAGHDAGAEAAATPAPALLTFGTHRYVSPCSVLPMARAECIYGPMKPLGYVRQQFYDRPLTDAELRRKTDTFNVGPYALMLP